MMMGGNVLVDTNVLLRSTLTASCLMLTSRIA